jgi:hypothetical protein
MKPLFLISFFLISIFTSAQQFQKYYGTANNEDAFSTDVTADNGFILCGSSFGNGTGGTDVMLTKTDSAGNLVWSKIYGGTGNEMAIYVKTVPGGYVFSGETFSIDPAGDAYIAKADLNGNLLWWKNYGTAGYDIAYEITPLSDGSYIVSGLDEHSSSSYDAFLMHVDANGDSLWTRSYAAPGIEHAVRVIHTNDNGYLFCGKMFTYANTPGWSDVWLVKTDLNGDTLWTSIIGGPVWEEGMDVIESNGGYLICGGESTFGSGLYDAFLMKTDLNGHLLWSKTYGGPYIEDCYRLIEVPSGGYAMAGYTESFGPGNIRGTDSSNAFVVRTDFNGDTLWSMSYGGLLKEECFSIVNISTGGFAIAGYTGSFGDSLNGYIFTTDSMGYSGCNERRAHPDILTNAGFVESHHSVDVFAGMNKTVPVISVSAPPTIHAVTVCWPAMIMDENNPMENLQVYPNPADDAVNLQWNSKEHGEEITVSVYDYTGKIIQMQSNPFSENISVETKNLPPGIYFIRLASENETAVAAISIIH